MIIFLLFLSKTNYFFASLHIHRWETCAEIVADAALASFRVIVCRVVLWRQLSFGFFLYLLYFINLCLTYYIVAFHLMFSLFNRSTQWCLSESLGIINYHYMQNMLNNNSIMWEFFFYIWWTFTLLCVTLSVLV